MMKSANAVVLAFLILEIAGTSSEECRAEAMFFLGPAPYLSAADSPFPFDGSDSEFFLEDFEDGELNTPGIFQPLHHAFGDLWHGEVMGPGELTDSVDGDDGIVDGSGTDGHSFRSRRWIYSPMGIVRNGVGFDFEFDETELGFLPNSFGLVWTEGPKGIDFFRPGLSLGMTVTDLDGNRSWINDVKVERTVNSDRTGDTSEDFFLGVISDVPIAEVSFSGVYFSESEPLRDYLEIDHIQYGRLPIFDPGPAIEADFDGDGAVFQGDLDLVLANWGEPSTNAPAEWVNDMPEGSIDQSELDKILTNWGNVRHNWGGFLEG